MHDRALFSRPVPSRRPCLTAVLRMAGLRPTRQRVALAELLFGGPHRHVSAEALHAEALMARVNVSLATIYNTLHQFRTAGLLREVAVDASRSYFDTDTSDHHHFYLEDEELGVNPLQGARWFSLAARKGYGPAQARLGDMLFNGHGIVAQPAEGLMWLTLAHQNTAGTVDEGWVNDLLNAAMATATSDVQTEAAKMTKAYGPQFHAQ